MKTPFKIVLAVATIGLLASVLPTRAATISSGSELDFGPGAGGSVTLGPGPQPQALGTATEVLTWNAPIIVTKNTGDFAAAALGSSVSFTQPWTFNSASHPALWTASPFSFDLISSSIVSQSATFLNVAGSGIINSGGLFDPTPGLFTFTISNAGGNPQEDFTFQATNTAVPDSGATVALLGLALTGLEGVRRILRRNGRKV